MKNIKKGFTAVEIIVVVAIIAILVSVVLVSIKSAHASVKGCGGFFERSCPSDNEMRNASQIQDGLISAVAVPQLQTSMERVNIKRRAEIFNTEDKISYIYLVNFGKVMAFFTVKGKVSSLQSYMIPTEKLVYGNGDTCTEKGTSAPECYVVAAADIDGAYGENPAGIFFFTTEGAYVEWKGDYMMSDQPLRLATQPELVRQIK